ncbi:hypothetical protein O0880_09740 [Janthinobacterium sp. SUN118]|uniref:hypothetical protein n=1 Tax=Janthinobacterium sp. SUN118 TaxID=3004100 RepID=UPI0025B26C01|nr:hypothetical protein [Janthinobacterium sp. SUN118]MDN2709701.1 hypothetical protein [Janthinobacterium sp. SUN118]
MRAATGRFAGGASVFLIFASKVRMAAMTWWLVQATVALAGSTVIDLPQAQRVRVAQGAAKRVVALPPPELTHNGGLTTVDEARHEQGHA